jgi:drug/metabolite transporter (DMT)-like permease
MAVSLLTCFCAFQILLAMGLQREKAGRAVSVTYLQIVYASLYQLVFLHVPIQPLSAIGMAVILVSAGWVAAAKA